MGPALAQQVGQPHGDARLGYSVSIPAGFAPAPVSGVDQLENGQGFRTGTATLSVAGSPLVGADLATALAPRIISLGQQGWQITQRTITPNWAALGASKGSQRLSITALIRCSGTQYVQIQARYMSTDTTRYAALTDQIGATLGGTCP